MAMNKKEKLRWAKRLAIGAAIIVIVTFAWLLIRFTSWKRETIARLQTGSQVAQTPRGPIEYATQGEGPAILIIHGTPGGYDQGMAFVSENPGFKSIAVSRPGYLRTPLETGQTPAEQADAFAALLDVLNIPKVAAVAISGGGPSALQFALRYPERCWGLVLVCAITQPLSPTSHSSSFNYKDMFLISDFAQWIALKMPWRLMPEEFKEKFPTAEKRGMFLKLSGSTAPISLRRAGVNNDRAQVATLSIYPLEDIRCPTLVLHGTEDAWVPISHAEFAAGKIPAVDFVSFEKGDHFFVITHKEQAEPKLVEWLKAYAKVQ
jgi:pimeloyl-ACP methyl ester carboxylesterase